MHFLLEFLLSPEKGKNVVSTRRIRQQTGLKAFLLFCLIRGGGKGGGGRGGRGCQFLIENIGREGVVRGGGGG